VGLVPLSVIILTYNEEVNLPGALESVVGWAEQVFVVDSFSTDNTLKIAEDYGIPVYQNSWTDWATQRNWAMDNLPLKHEWVLFLDTDERVSSDLAKEISETLANVSPEISGFYINRRFIFMRRWLRHGGYNPNWVLRLVRHKKTRVLPAGDSEYFQVDGKVLRLKNYMIHEDKKDLHFFTHKHNRISDMAARRLFYKERVNFDNNNKRKDLEGKYRVWVKENILANLPLFVRPFVIFFYKYFLKLGILDGKEGFVYYFLHDFWYPFLIDAKLLEMRYKSSRTKQSKI